jgi:pyruvate-ferredoxin/flavodoxin oxidoreductase
MVRDVKPGGTFLINCQWSFEELEQHLTPPPSAISPRTTSSFYTIDAIDLAMKIGMGKRTNTMLQSAFFALAKVLPAADALQYMKDAATHSYLKKGQDIVDMNHKAIDLGATAFKKVEVPASWATAEDEPETTASPAVPPP